MTKPTIDLKKSYTSEAEVDAALLERNLWIREAVRLMDLAKSDVSNGYYNDELAEELRALIAQVKREEP